jgi:hypothetical protein
MNLEQYGIRRTRPYSVRVRYKRNGAKRAASVIRRVQASTDWLAHDLALSGARRQLQMGPADGKIIAVEILDV